MGDALGLTGSEKRLGKLQKSLPGCPDIVTQLPEFIFRNFDWPPPFVRTDPLPDEFTLRRYCPKRMQHSISLIIKIVWLTWADTINEIRQLIPPRKIQFLVFLNSFLEWRQDSIEKPKLHNFLAPTRLYADALKTFARDSHRVIKTRPLDVYPANLLLAVG